MFRISDHVPGHQQQARRELAASWDHLINAAEHGARQVGHTSRRQGKIARDRVAAARLALLGERPPAPWRWLGAGLTAGLSAGLAISALGARALARRKRAADQTATGPAADQTATEPATEPPLPVATIIRERAGAGAEALRDGTRAAVHGATATARDAAGKLRDRLTHHGPADQPADGAEPPGPARSPSVATPGQ
jgi:hypothetical protein